MSFQFIIFFKAFISLIHNFGNAVDVCESLANNSGKFDFGFNSYYWDINEDKLKFESYLFIGKHYWTLNYDKYNSKIINLTDAQSRENENFNAKYRLCYNFLIFESDKRYADNYIKLFTVISNLII